MKSDQGHQGTDDTSGDRPTVPSALDDQDPNSPKVVADESAGTEHADGDTSSTTEASLGAGDRKKNLAAVIIGVLVLVVSTAFILQPSGYANERPGPVVEVELKENAGESEQLDATNGRFSFTTIEIRELRIGEVLLAKMLGQDLVLLSPESASYDPGTQMLLSKQRAVATAFAISQGQAPSTAVVITGVVAASPAATAGLRVGDIIIAETGIDGSLREITDPQDLVEIIDTQQVTLVIERRGAATEKLTMTVTPRAGVIGVTVSTIAATSFTGLEIPTNGVGGASAGLMFTLAALDHLTSGDLTGGKHVSGSGTIEAAGVIGPVSGVSLKAEAAAAAGADVFFIGRSNQGEIGTHPAMEVVAVDTVSDALMWLCDNGAVAACTYVS